jgi:hypothetical protein
VVRVLGVDGELHTDAFGRIRISAVGGDYPFACVLQLMGPGTFVFEGGTRKYSAPLIGGVATFAGLRVDTFPCLGHRIHLLAEVQTSIEPNDLGGGVDPSPLVLGNLPQLALADVASNFFNITHGEASFLELSRTSIQIYNRNTVCLQTFQRGEATLSVTVRDEQGSPVSGHSLPIDLRVCEEPPPGSTTPICPSRTAALVGTTQVMPYAGVAHFSDWAVTNVSYGHLLSVYTNLLTVAYTEPFSACDAGWPQEMRFVHQPPPTVQAGSTFPEPPAIQLFDGFGNAVRRLPARLPPAPTRTHAARAPDSHAHPKPIARTRIVRRMGARLPEPP